MSVPGYPFPWILQMYCFPYRTLDRHRATRSTESTAHWPWHAYIPEEEDDVKSAMFGSPSRGSASP